MFRPPSSVDFQRCALLLVSCARLFSRTDMLYPQASLSLDGIHMKDIRFTPLTRQVSRKRVITLGPVLVPCSFMDSLIQTTSLVCHEQKLLSSASPASPWHATEMAAQVVASAYVILQRIRLQNNSLITATS